MRARGIEFSRRLEKSSGRGLNPRALFRSFSFRAGALLFITICTALMVFRVVIYYESLAAAYTDTQAVIRAHMQEIDEAVTRYGPGYARTLVSEILKDPPDMRLVLAYRDGENFIGNIREWPVFAEDDGAWKEISAAREDGGRERPLLVTTRPLKRKAELLVGYELYRLDTARRELYQDILENVAISLVLSGCLSVAMVYLVNRQFLKFNRTCDQVIAGRIGRRVPVSAGNDQFDRLGNNVNKMLDWITTLLDTVRDSSNALAHDMRTPLSYHRLELQALADDSALPAPVRQKMREAVGRIDAVVEMFDNILNISKAESRSSTELFAEFDIAQTVRDVAEFYAPLFEERSQSLAADIPGTPIPFTGDEQLVTQAVVNLIDNAIKYTPEGGRISVSVGEKRGEATITVADNGPGIEAGLREKAKERFFRLDKSRNTVGSGLGLSLVNAVAGLHRGAFLLEDNAPGLKAVLKLPLQKLPAAEV